MEPAASGNAGQARTASSNEPLDIIFTAAADFVQASNITISNWQLSVYDQANRLLGQSIVSGYPGTAMLSFPGLIWRAQFTLAPGGTASAFGIDDLVLGVDGEAPVPEPASMTLLATGLAGLALRARRRRGADVSPADAGAA